MDGLVLFRVLLKFMLLKLTDSAVNKIMAQHLHRQRRGFPGSFGECKSALTRIGQK